jgi:hypothetical protein
MVSNTQGSELTIYSIPLELLVPILKLACCLPAVDPFHSDNWSRLSTVSLVSRKWREIVVDTPELHCDIDFSRVNRARLMLRRAASSPISIRYRSDKTRDSATAIEGVALIASASPAAIVALNVMGNDELLEQAVRCLCYGPAPALQSIRFERTSSNDFFGPSFNIFPPEALHRPFQSLVELSLNNCRINWDQIPSNAFPVLLKLDISFMDFTHVVLNHTPKLRELSVINVRLIYPSASDSLKTTVIIPCLRSLTLIGPLRAILYTLLELISFPGLTKLDIICSFEPREQNGMAAFLHHCGLRQQGDDSEFELSLDILSIDLSLTKICPLPVYPSRSPSEKSSSTISWTQYRMR